MYNIEYQLYAETAFFIKIWRKVYIISFADISVSMIRSKTIIGREGSVVKSYVSGKSEFVALYGKRRIGKTFLVREMFKDEFVFYASGILEGDAGSQLDSFNRALKDY